MKIIYTNNETKEKCKNKIKKIVYRIDVEKILKCFSFVLGTKVIVLDYTSNYDEKTISLKIKNVNDNKIKTIKITTLMNEIKKISNVFSYLVSINENINENIEVRNTYTLFKKEIKHIESEKYNKESNTLIKYNYIYPDITNFTIIKDNEKYHFWINTTDERVIKRFLEFDNLSIENIYTLLNELDNIFASNIKIGFDNYKNKESKKIKKLINNQ